VSEQRRESKELGLTYLQGWCLLLPDKRLRHRGSRWIGELLQVRPALETSMQYDMPYQFQTELSIAIKHPLTKPSVFESELQDVIPICHATIAGTRIVGRLIVG
jgi:hypothetical protein